MQSPGATDLATRSNSGSDFNHTKPNQEVDDSYPMEKVRCLCGSSLTTESTIKVEFQEFLQLFCKIIMEVQSIMQVWT